MPFVGNGWVLTWGEGGGGQEGGEEKMRGKERDLDSPEVSGAEWGLFKGLQSQGASDCNKQCSDATEINCTLFPAPISSPWYSSSFHAKHS